MSYIILDSFAQYHPVLDKHGDVKEFRQIERAIDYLQKNDTFGSWIVVNVSGDDRKCDKCKTWFQLSGDCIGPITCPYCRAHVEG